MVNLRKGTDSLTDKRASSARRRTAATRSIRDLFRLFVRTAPERPAAAFAPAPRPDDASVARAEPLAIEEAPERSAAEDVATAFAALQSELEGLLAMVEKAPAGEGKR